MGNEVSLLLKIYIKFGQYWFHMNISVTISTKTYYASLSFYLVQAFGTAIGFVNLITK